MHCYIGVCMPASEHMRHKSDASHELTLGLPHYMYGVQVQQLHIGDEMHRFCSQAASSYVVIVFYY